MDKILYIVGNDPTDKRSWSGICYSCLEQLKKHYEVETLVISQNPIEKVGELLLKILYKSLGKTYSTSRSLFFSKRLCSRMNKILANKSKDDYKAIFLIGSHLGAFIKTNIPILYYTDATYRQMIGYYPGFKDQKESGDKLQNLTFKNTTWDMLASDWARNGAIKYYNVDPKKCFVGKFGANVDTSKFSHRSEKDVRNLLFVGVDWKRKGGDVAVECMRYLKDIDPSHKYMLHLVGVKPPYEIIDDNITVYGFINRNIPEQKDLMISLREKADLFFLPTKAECAGIVFCESSAYGIPSVTYETGGIGSYIIDGENGYKLPLGSSGKDFAKCIVDIFNNPSKLDYMREKAKEMYHENMNWDHLGNLIKSTIG